MYVYSISIFFGYYMLANAITQFIIYQVAQEIRFLDLVTYMRDSGYAFQKPNSQQRSG